MALRCAFACVEQKQLPALRKLSLCSLFLSLFFLILSPLTKPKVIKTVEKVKLHVKKQKMLDPTGGPGYCTGISNKLALALASVWRVVYHMCLQRRTKKCLS